jgi:serine/threonine protein kinase
VSEGYSRKAGDLVGPYTLLRPLGKGGFSEVWEGRREGGVFDFAIKILIHPEHVAQLKQEADALSVVRGKGIVAVAELGLENDPPYLVLELQGGGDLRRRLNHGALRPAPAISIFLEILEILARVHREGIVHGDLKPENVLFGEGGRVKLADFGLSRRLVQRSATLSVSLSLEDARLAGTLDYMAPEQRAGAKPTARSDVFAAGVLLYELLTGERPQGIRALPGARDRGLPPVVDRVLACSLAPDPRHRFPSAGAMLDYLRTGLGSDWSALARARLAVIGLAESQSDVTLVMTLLLVTLFASRAVVLGGPKTMLGLEGCLVGVGATVAIWLACLPWIRKRREVLSKLREGIEMQIDAGDEIRDLKR